jgi:hypothetical protein
MSLISDQVTGEQQGERHSGWVRSREADAWEGQPLAKKPRSSERLAREVAAGKRLPAGYGPSMPVVFRPQAPGVGRPRAQTTAYPTDYPDANRCLVVEHIQDAELLHRLDESGRVVAREEAARPLLHYVAQLMDAAAVADGGAAAASLFEDVLPKPVAWWRTCSRRGITGLKLVFGTSQDARMVLEQWQMLRAADRDEFTDVEGRRHVSPFRLRQFFPSREDRVAAAATPWSSMVDGHPLNYQPEGNPSWSTAAAATSGEQPRNGPSASPSTPVQLPQTETRRQEVHDSVDMHALNVRSSSGPAPMELDAAFPQHAIRSSECLTGDALPSQVKQEATMEGTASMTGQSRDGTSSGLTVVRSHRTFDSSWYAPDGVTPASGSALERITNVADSAEGMLRRENATATDSSSVNRPASEAGAVLECENRVYGQL